MSWVLYSIALVVINDTMAYLFGITLGKHALLPEISPKKTVEGFAGAAVSTVLASMLLLPTKKDALVLSLVSSLVGPFGGFLASVIKRAYGKKDFGDMMPVSQHHHIMYANAPFPTVASTHFFFFLERVGTWWIGRPAGLSSLDGTLCVSVSRIYSPCTSQRVGPYAHGSSLKTSSWL